MAEQPTVRRLEVLSLLAQGLTKKKVGERLLISESTVKTHTMRMCTDLGAHNVPHLISLAYQKGWLTVENEK